MTLEPSCVHWWIIDNFSIGHCKKCGEIVNFKKLLEEKKPTKTIHKKNK